MAKPERTRSRAVVRTSKVQNAVENTSSAVVYSGFSLSGCQIPKYVDYFHVQSNTLDPSCVNDGSRAGLAVCDKIEFLLALTASLLPRHK